MLKRPDPSEYDPFYATYIDRVPEGDIVALMTSELDQTLALLRGVRPQDETFRYAVGKWSIREVVGHLIDAERMFAYRALVFARGDAGPLPGMDQNEWADASKAGLRPLAGLLDEFEHLRRSHAAMFGGFDAVTGDRSGIASERSFTVRSLAYILVGHELHHRKVLRDLYLEQ